MAHYVSACFISLFGKFLNAISYSMFIYFLHFLLFLPCKLILKNPNGSDQLKRIVLYSNAIESSNALYILFIRMVIWDDQEREGYISRHKRPSF